MSFVIRKNNSFHLGKSSGNSLVVQQLGLHVLTAKGPGSMPGQGTNILHDAWCSQKKKEKMLNSVHVCVCTCVCMNTYACGRWKGIPGRKNCRHKGKELVWLQPAV